MRSVLVATDRIAAEDLTRLSKFAEVVEAWRMNDAEILPSLPVVDAAIILGWPSFFTRENLSRMKKLRFIQTVSVGVNQVHFQDLPVRVTVCSNAGAYSTGVGEHAWGLLLAAAKRIPQADAAIRAGGATIEGFRAEAKDVMILRGKTMGIVAYGGIGRAVARFARVFGMDVVALTRRRGGDKGVRFYRGAKGLKTVLRLSDAVLISIPLTRLTEGLIGARELGLMKKDAVLVNVSRGDVVNQRALYEHLAANASFSYATDVWWYREGKETLETEFPFSKLSNFVGTPHISGPSTVASGEPQGAAVTNTVRYLRGLRPRNVVDASEYQRSG
ncbi:MAG TPA: 2-hydroxyacid dehydrogenase [Nitrososphaerales archaeon]|nr:2-hydroxyacid dehydrogenase [Nitrososphaerales archaeon]